MLYQRSRYQDAERELGLALTKDPEEPWAYALLGACRAEQKDFAQADELGRQALALAPDSADIRHLVARIQFSRNDLAAAEHTITEAIRLAPHVASFYSLRAAIYAQQRAWSKTIADCEAALKIDPEHVEAINMLSLARRSTGDVCTAAAELQRALEVHPQDAYSHANLGWTHLQSGRLAEAEQHFREALRLDPELEWARIGVLETLKANVPVYRWILNYFLWIQTKAAGAQWAIVIGLYVAYRLVQAVAANQPALAPFLMPLVFVYLLFVLATWFAKPLADTGLLLHPFGRLALTRREKWEGAIVTGLIVIVLGLLVASSVLDPGTIYLALAITIGLSALPLAMSFKFSHAQPRRILQMGAIAVTFAGILTMTDVFTNVVRDSLPLALYNALMPPLRLFFNSSALLTLVGANILASKQWRH
jgi:Flp pilus assembly protein TadD